MLPIILESQSELERDTFVNTFIEEHKIPAYNFFTYQPENKEMTIRQIREIIQEATIHTIEPRLFLILRFDTASIEAQNAFLKTLEEHQSNLHFILSVENANQLLPTIRSRSRTVKKRVQKSKELSSELIHLVQSLEKGTATAMVKIGNSIGKTQATEFCDSLIAYYRNKLPSDSHAPLILQEIIKQRNLFTNNHVDSQTTIDSILITIYKTYNTPQA